MNLFQNNETFLKNFTDYVFKIHSKGITECSNLELYTALCTMVNDEAISIRTKTSERHAANKEKKIYYFSLEFLIGKLLDNYLINLGIRDVVDETLKSVGVSLEALEEEELDPGLGNGGLGRLAACFIDSMAAHCVPGVGMGIRYRFGLFKQRIENGYQIEYPDNWLVNGYPWETAKQYDSVTVKFGGTVERSLVNGKLHFEHKNYTSVKAIPYDVNIVGYNGGDVNSLRLWHAQPMVETIDMDAFNKGDYSKALETDNSIEAINCILYPDDSLGSGKKLRLMQEYFLVAAGIGSIIRSYKQTYGRNAWNEFPQHVSIHTNDTHPALCVPELMRVLVDEEHLEWDDAWEITKNTISFTNHTVMPEALEKWSIPLLQALVPRVYMITEEIDRRWREYLQQSNQATANRLKNTAILWDGEAKMANLSIIGAHSVNGVAALHTQILKDTVFNDYYQISPEKFNNKTNGVSHRRFLIQSNPALTNLINESIGTEWMRDMSKIEGLLAFKDDAAFLEKLAAVKFENKKRLAKFIAEKNEIAVDPNSIFDIQVKRLHAYKRQLLNALKILDLYNQLKENPNADVKPTTFIFSAKAAQGYALAKEIIKFINSVADLVNSDPQVSKVIKVIFLENFNVSLGQIIYPAAEISEQISTAGKEASGTGNMKFMMNGAITLGTLDGANVEIKEQVGDENIKIFGITAHDTQYFYEHGGYSSKWEIEHNQRTARLTSQLVDDTFKNSGMNFWGIYDDLITRNDQFFVLKDFESYMSAWKDLANFHDSEKEWQKVSLVNIAKSGFFSSDRTIKEYSEQIWNTQYK